MTSRERILRGMRGQPVDRIACAPRMWKFNRAYFGDHSPQIAVRAAEEFGYDPLYYSGASVPSFLGPYITPSEALPDGVSCSGRIAEGSDYDTVYRHFSTPAGSLTDIWRRPHPGRGYGISPAPSHVEYLLKSPADLECLRYLTAPPVQKALETFTELTEFFGDNGVVSPYVRSPFNDLSYVLPVVESLIMPYDNPEFLRGVLAFFQEACLEDIKAHLERGASTIFISGFHVSLSVGWSPAIFREFFLPLIKQQADLTHEGGAVFHYYDDGHVMKVLDMMVEAGVDVFSTCTPAPAGDFALRAAKDIVGDRLALMGYVDIESILHRGTPELVERTVREAIEILGADDHFVLSSSDGILTQTPMANIKAYFEAARKYGTR